MIYDTLTHLEHYRALIPHFDEIVTFLNTTKLFDLEIGSHTLIENQLKIKVQEITTQPQNERPWESHKEWIDIQVPCSAPEGIGAVYTDAIPAVTDSHPEKDTWYHEECDRSYGVLSVYPGEFILFMPGELHKPRCMVRKPETIRKIIIKVRANS